MADETGGDPPCFAHNLVAGQPVDAETARDVARFRKAERDRLYKLRRKLSQDEAAAQAAAIRDALTRTLAPAPGMTVSVYWPIRGEPDLRPWMAEAHDAGAQVALPVVVTKGAPLVFRPWAPGCRMERGLWNIPVPTDGPDLRPDTVIAPLVGLDEAGFRLGNGGGYFDRTLAALDPLPRRIAVGHDFVRIKTIYPMPWDIGMDSALLGDGTTLTFAQLTAAH